MVIRQKKSGYSLMKNKGRKKSERATERQGCYKGPSHTGALGTGSLLTPPITNPKNLVFNREFLFLWRKRAEQSKAEL